MGSTSPHSTRGLQLATVRTFCMAMPTVILLVLITGRVPRIFASRGTGPEADLNGKKILTEEEKKMKKRGKKDKDGASGCPSLQQPRAFLVKICVLDAICKGWTRSGLGRLLSPLG